MANQQTQPSGTVQVRTTITPDSLGDKMLLWLEQNVILTAAVLGGIIIVVLGWIFYDRMADSAARNSFEQVDRAIAVYRRPIGVETGFASLEELQAAAKGGANAKRFENREARARAVQEQLGADAVANVKPRGPELMGAFYSAVTKLETNQPDEAAAAFAKIEQARPAWEPVGALAGYTRAAALSEAGKYAEAGAAFRAVAKSGGDAVLKSQALYQAALNFRAAGMASDARSALEELRNTEPQYAEEHGVGFLLDELNSSQSAAGNR